MQTKKKASAPCYHASGTRYATASEEAATIIPFEGGRRTARPERSQFKAGVMVGFLMASMVFLAVLWLFVIPTMDQAVQQAQQAASCGVVSA